MRVAAAKALRREVANDNGVQAVPSAAPALWPERVRRATDKAGELLADAFVIGGALLLLHAMGWL